MNFCTRLATTAALAGTLLFSLSAQSQEAATSAPIVIPEVKVSFVDRASANVQDALEQALDMVGIRYKRGGSNPEAGFDCSGLVRHAFREGLGLELPQSSREISKAADVIKKDELRPGDLVFFNTMRRTFSHVGIYLGDNLFVHAPRSGASVRIEDMRARYWVKRFNGARRVSVE